ncbi:MMPL family transporter [Nonomuraea sp. NPDC005983]|uniref:MMPL family transporter n=1 Tax=Nonomuraea sp. NPDC005983 TaxID=3155595 RepID=UPI00339ED19E
MFESVGRLVYRGRWMLLVLSLVAAVLLAPFGLDLFGRMADGGFEDPSADSTTAARWNDEWYGGDTPDVVVLYRHPTVKVRDPRFKKAVHDSLRALPAQYVRTSATYWTTGSRKLASADGHSTYALISLKGGTQAKQQGYAAIRDRLAVRNLEVSVGGPVPLLKELNDQTGADLARAEAISTPVLLVLLVVVFGSLVAAGLPLLVGAVAVVGALVLLRLLTEVTEVSVFALNVVTMLGLGLAVDYSLFVLNAFRDEIGRGASTEQAVVRTMATAGRTVAFSGLSVATPLLGLLLFPQMFLRSIGLGAAVVVLVAMGAALVVLPAALSVLGRHVDAIRITPDFGRARGAGGAWHAVASSVMRRPVVYLLAVTAALVALALPVLHVQFGGVDHRMLPATSESRRVAEAVDRDFARNSMAAIDVHVLFERSFAERPATPGPLGQGYDPVSSVTQVNPTDAKPFADRLKRLPGVTGVDLAGLSQDNGAVRLAVRYSSDPMSAGARKLVTLIRSMAKEPNVRQVVVGGATAAQLDLLDSLLGTLPWLALVVGGVTFALLSAAFGSVLLPIKALLTNALSIGASFGVIVWAFQDGHLAAALDFTSTGTIEPTVAVLILAVVFGLSMDYELFLLSRVRAEWLRTRDSAAAVASGLQRTGGVITSAALLLLVVVGAFCTAGVTIVKLVGVGVFVAIAVDATLVRALLVPATMRLLGDAAWWRPRFPSRDHNRPAPQPRALPSGPATSSACERAASRAPEAGARQGRVIKPNPDGPGWYWAEEDSGPSVTVNGRPARFGADTDPVPVSAEHEAASGKRAPLRKLPYSTPAVRGGRRPAPEKREPGQGGRQEAEQRERREGWVRVGSGRTRVVRANPDGPGWMWVEVDA